MGDRSNYVLVWDGRWELFYSHWGAVSLDLDLLAGPEAATRFIRAQRAVDPADGGWLDDVWCEGAALVDHDRKRLCFYTDHFDEAGRRAAVLAVMAFTWPGWQVDWAYDGLGDLVAHVGQDPAIVRCEIEPDEPAAGSDDWVECLVTVAGDGGTRAYGLGLTVREVIGHGPAIIDRLPGGTGRAELTAIPGSGVHLDPATRTAGVWTMLPLAGAMARTASLWPGWTWEMWSDRYTEQVTRADGTVTLPDPDPHAALEDLRERLERHRGHDPVGRAREVLTEIGGGEMTTSPHFFDHEVAPPEQAEYATVLTAIAAVSQGRG
jgi:hypothetical protein